MGNEGDRMHARRRRRVLGGIALGVSALVIALVAKSPSVSAYSTTISSSVRSSTGGGADWYSDCATGGAGEVLYQIDVQYTTYSNEYTLTYPQAYCADLVASGTALNQYRRTIGPVGNTGTGWVSNPNGGCNAYAGEVIVGAYVYKTGIGMVKGVAIRCGSLPTGGVTRTLGVLGQTSGTVETVDCPTGQVAAGLYVGYGSILDKFGFRCATVSGANQSTVSMTSSSSAIFGTNLALTASGGSGTGAYSFTKVSGNCTVSGSTMTPTAVGSCVVTATRASDTNYAQATSANQTITISQRTPTFSWSNVTKTFGDSAFTLSAPTVTNGVAGSWSYASSNTGVINLSGSGNATAAILGSGSSTITGTFTPTDAVNNVSGGTITMVITVNKATQTITFADPADRSWSSTPFAVAPSASSGLAVALASSTAGTCSVSGLNVTMLASGTCTLTASQAGNGNYNAAPNASQSFVISPIGRTGFTGNSGSIVGTTNGTTYVVERFTTVGTTTWKVPKGVTSLDVLVVGGGGGGGSRGAGGGGAGGFVEASNVSVVPGTTLSAVVGGGGSGAPSAGATAGSAGSSSSIVGITANGGFGGRVHGDGAWGGNSGSGSGGTSYSSVGGRGRESNLCGFSDWCGGGGGGAGSPGSDAVSTGGAGGSGRASTITGVSITYAGGGGGGGGSSGNPSSTPTAGGSGGSGGGGSGGTPTWNGAACTVTDGVSGTSSLGGGGGGSSYCDYPASGSGQGTGGDGGSGIVIVRYAVPTVSEPDLTVASDTGSSTTDNITNLTTVTLSGTAPIGSVVQLSTATAGTSPSSGTWTNTGSTCSADTINGDWTCTTGVLAAGSYAVRAVAVSSFDGVSTTQTSATALSVAIDTSVPTSSGSISATHTNASSTAVVFTVSDNVAVASVEVFRSTNSNLSGATSCGSAIGLSGLSTSATITCTGLSSENTFFVYSVATDAAGNVETTPLSADDSIIRDSTAPTVLVTRSGSGTLLVGQTSTVTFTLSESSADFVVGDVSVSGGSLSGFASTSATVFTATFTPIANASGTASLSVAGGAFTDAAGNGNSASTSLAITYDTLRPTVLVTRSGSGTLLVGQTSTVTFTLSESSADFVVGDVSVSGGSLSGFASTSATVFTATFTPTANASGTASLSVAGGAFTDAAGNGNSASTSLAITYDTAAPTAPAALALDSTSDSGTSNSDRVTNVSTPTMNATVGETGGSVTFTATGGSTCVVGSVASLSVSCTFTTLAAGVHSITATHTDSAGNVSSASSGVSITIDTTAPSVSSFSSAVSSPTSSSSIAFTLSMDAAVSGLAGSDFENAGTASCSFGVSASSGTSFTVTATCTSDGTVQPRLKVTSVDDTAGNSGPGSAASASTTITRDSTAPSAPGTPDLAIGDDSGSSGTDNVTSVTSPSVSVVAAESGGTTTVTATKGASSVQCTMVSSTLGASCSLTSLSDGTWSIAATDRDAAGNTSSTSTSLSVTIDTTAPSVSSFSSAVSSPTSYASIAFTLSMDAAVGGLDGSDFGNAGSATCSFSASASSGVNFTVTGSCSTDGTVEPYLVAASVSDTAGNSGPGSATSASTTITRDSTAPSAPGTPDLVAVDDTGSSNSDDYTKKTSIGLSVTVSEVGGSAQIIADNGSTQRDCSGTPATSTFTCSVTGLSHGSWTLTSRHIDEAGNVSTSSAGLTVFIDTQVARPSAPTLDSASDTGSSNSDRITNDTTPTVTTVVGEVGGSLIFNGGGGSACSQSVTGLSVSCTFLVSWLGGGSVTATHTDKAGNVSAVSVNTVINIDTSAPDAPSAPVLATASDSGSNSSDRITNVTTPSLSVTTGETGGSLTFTSSLGGTCIQNPVTSFAPTCVFGVLGAGAHQITAVHTDSAGNSSATSSVTAITIDTSAPVVTFAEPLSPSRSLVYSLTSNEGLTGVAAGDFNASAGCSVTVTESASTSFAVGLSGCPDGGVSLALSAGSVQDIAGNGNASAISAPVVVYDTTAPSVSAFSAAGSISSSRGFDLSLTFDATVSGLASEDFSNVGSAGVCVFTPNVTTSASFTVGVVCPQDGTLIARLRPGAVTDTAGNSGPTLASDSSTVTIATGPTTLVLIAGPDGAASGVAFTTQPVIEMRNDAGQAVTGTSATVTATVTQVSGTGVLAGSSTASVDTTTGRAIFSNLGLSGTAGTSYTISFTSTVLGTVLTPATASASVSVGPATQLAVTTQPVGSGAGAVLATQPTVAVRDSGGNLVTTSSAPISVVSSGGTLGGTTTVNASSGLASFTNLDFAGFAGTNYQLTFSSSGLAQTMSSNFSVTVGAPTKIVLTTTAAGARYGQNFTTQPVVEVQDAGGNKVAVSPLVTASLSGGVVVGTNQSTSDATAVDGVATFSGLGILGTPGQFTITYSSAGLAGTSQNITVARALQTINFTDPSDVTYSATAIPLTATASSILPVSFSETTPSICTVSGSEVTPLRAGTCTISADQSGDTNFEPAPTATQSFVINKALPTFTWENVTKTYGNSPFTVQAPTSSVAGTFTYSSSNTAVILIGSDGTTFSVAGGGAATISATFQPSDTDRYVSGGVVTMVVTVLRATQQPVSLTSTTGVYGNPLTLTVGGGNTNGSLSFSVQSGSATNCAVSGSSLTSTSKGTCIVTATMAADTNYLSATTPPTTVTLSARPITIVADTKSRDFGDNDPALTYTVTVGAVVNGDLMTGSLVRDAGEDVGFYTIRRGSLDNPNYDIIFQTGQFEITRRPITATADTVSKHYGDPDPSLTYSITNGNLILGNPLTGQLQRATGENVGTRAITQGTLTNANNPNYAITFVSRDLTITRRPVTVSAVAASKKYSTTDPVFTYNTQNVVSGEQLVGVLDRASGENVGDYAIGQGTLTDANNPNYSINFVSANLNIFARPITVTADPKQITYGDSDPTFTYVVGGDGLKTGDSLSGSLARVAGANAGQHVITQGTLANANYAIQFFGAYLTIVPKPITVTANPLTITYGDPEPTLTFAAGINDLVGGDTLSGSLARAAGSNAGTYAISQGSVTSANNPNYTINFIPATLTIQQAPQTPLAITQSQKTYGIDLPLTFTGGSGDGAADFSVVNAGTAGCSFSGAVLSSTGGVGTTCSIVLTKAASLNFLSATTSATITVQPRQVTVSANSPIKIYGEPDPVLTYNITSGTLADGDALTGSLSRAPGTTPGTYAITRGTLGHPDYVINFVPGTLTINSRPITVTAAPAEKLAGAADPSLTYSVTSGLLADGDQLTGSLTRSPGESIGTYAISQGTLNHASYDIVFVPALFTISGVTQSAVTLTADVNPIVRGSTANLSVSGGDGTGAVSFSIVSESPTGACTIGASTVSATVTGNIAGSCSIQAVKASDGTYSAAESPVLTITVERQSQTITFASPGDQNYSPIPFLVAPSSDSGLSVALVSTTTSVCSVEGYLVQMLFRGVCELVASIGQSANYFAAASVTVQVSVSAVLPGAPTISALTATADSIAVTFEAGHHGGEVITGYEYSLDAGVTWIAFPAGSITSPLVISGTNASSQYDVLMRSLTPVGTSLDSNSMSVSTPAPPQSQNSGGGSEVSSTVVTTTPTSTTITTTTVVTLTTASTSPSSTAVATTVVRTTVTETTIIDSERSTVVTERDTTTEVVEGESSSNGGDTDRSTGESGTGSGRDTTSIDDPIEMSPGESVARRDGEIVQMTWTPQASGGASTSWNGVELTVAASNGGSPDPLLPDGTIAIEQGTDIRIDASGLEPSSRVEGWLYSEPTFLGDREVDIAGRLTTTFEVPDAIDIGGHTFKMVLIEGDGTVAELSIGVIVLDASSAAAHRDGELSDEVAEMLTAPSATGFTKIEPGDASLLTLWLILLLVLVAGVGRSARVRSRRAVPDFIAVVVDDAHWVSRHRMIRWLTPMVGFVLGAWASANTGAMPLAPTTLLMLALLLLGAADPFAGLVAGVSFATGVVVGGGVDSVSGAVSLLVLASAWSAPGLAGSAVARIVGNKLLVIPAVIRATVATALMVALLENLPVHTSIETTANRYVTEFAWLVAIVSLTRSWLDYVLGDEETRREPRRNLVASLVGIASMTLVTLSQPDVPVWNLAGLITFVTVVLWRIRIGGRFGGRSGYSGWASAATVLVLAVAAVGTGERTSDRSETTQVIDVANTLGTPLGEVVVDVDSYPYVFERVVLPGHQVVVMNEILGVFLSVASVLADGDVVPLDDERLNLVIGHEVEISGEGLAAGSPIETWLFSTPRQLGVGEVTSQGRVDALFPVPKGQPLGDHELRIRVMLTNGKSALVTLPVALVPSVPQQSF